MLNIAIDGPAGAGKSTVADIVAERLGILHLDTGAMYRALGLWALANGIDAGDRGTVARHIDEAKVDVRYEDGAQRVYLNGGCVDGLIRTDAVSRAASDISALPEVRVRMVELQRQIAARHDLVMDGRDIGSCVLSDSPLKFYVTASAEVRARRRALEYRAKGIEVNEREILDSINARDLADMTREFSPLVCPPDATVLDTSDMTIEEVVAAVMEKIHEKAD